MAKEVKIYDAIEYIGEWWVVGEEDKKVYGVLKCSKEKQIRLEITGDLLSDSTLMKSNADVKFPIVLGDGYNGVITLLFCNGSWSGVRHDLSSGSAKKIVTMVFEFVIFGEHYESIEDIKFPEFIVEFSNLKYWMDRAPVTVKVFEKLALEEHSVYDFNVRIEQYGLKIKSAYSINDVSEEYETAGIRYTYYLLFEPDEPQSLEWYLNVVNKFKQFLTIYTDSLTYILFLQGINHERSKYISICNVPFPDYKKETRSRWNDFIISINNMSDNITEILNKWYALDHEDILYTYIGNIPSDRKTIQERFLGYARVIESLHRLQESGVKTTFIDPIEYNKIITKIMNSFKEDMNNDLWNKVNESLKHANEYGFQRRIKDVLKALPQDIEKRVCYGMKPSKYADVVRINRDYYTHFFAKPDNLLNDYEMIAMNFSLKLICFWMISRKIGISDENLIGAMLHRGRWLDTLDFYSGRFR
ncbi:HEPN domain-containing protein [Paenibacillus sp. IITD108]|uniref:ApeA N-terminal domain 1-containing protein n=1 Tax=Paenibacillus sp. IITD108 TaxID=3116649 RepID=UPI002F4142A8